MLAPPRIALVSETESALWGEVGTLPSAPVLRRFQDLVGEADDLRRFGPRLVILRKSQLTAEDVGAWKLLHSLIPEATALAIVDGANLIAAQAIANPASLQVLGEPLAKGELADAIERALAPAPTLALDLLLELARAIADEVNNPLLFVSGHVRLLRESLDKERDKDVFARVLGVAENVVRIEATMNKLRTLVRAAGGTRQRQRLVFATLLREVLAKDGDSAKLSCEAVIPDELASATMFGDPALLGAAIRQLATASRELARDLQTLTLVVGPAERGLRLRVEFQPKELVAWDLPRDAEPWTLFRAVRGSAAQLSFLVVQAIAVAHGGSATLLRRPDERIVIELALPTC